MTPSILVTGCGFPDISTRALVSRISDLLKLPVFGVCDYNPFGVALLMTYKYGSKSKIFEGAGYQTLPLRWIALHASHIADMCANSLSTDMHGMHVVATDVSGSPFVPHSRIDVSSGSTLNIVEDMSAIDRRKLSLMIKWAEVELLHGGLPESQLYDELVSMERGNE